MGTLRDTLRRWVRLGMRLGVDSRGLALLAFSSSSPPLALFRARSVTGVDLLMVMGVADSIEFFRRCLRRGVVSRDSINASSRLLEYMCWLVSSLEPSVVSSW